MIDLDIRKAYLTDKESVAVLKQQVWISTYATEGISEEFANYVLSEFSVENISKTLSDKDKQVLVATFEGNIIGCIEISFNPEIPHQSVQGYPEIAVLYVFERFCGKGIGLRLLEESFKMIGNMGLTKTWLTVYHENHRAIDFYIKHHFTQIGEMDFILNGKRHKNLIILREIQHNEI